MYKREEIFQNWISYLNKLSDGTYAEQGFNLEEAENSLNEDKKIIRPSMYQIWIMDDSQISDELFLEIISEFFFTSSAPRLARILSEIRRDQQSLCGTYTREVAESKIIKIIDYSQSLEINIKCVMCKEQEYVSKKS